MDTGVQAGKALFLITGGVDYYARLIDLAGAPSAADRAAARKVLEAYRAKVQRRYETMRGREAVTDGDLARLVAWWDALWQEIEASVSPALWARIRTLAG